MCKHEFTQEEWIVEVCKNCGKLQQEIELEQQLAAANARIKILETELERNFLGEIKANARVAELEEKCKAQDDAIRIMENSIADDVEKTKQLEQRAEAAEAQCDEMEVINTDLCADNKRMQTAINRYVIGNIDLLDAMKAALEEKP